MDGACIMNGERRGLYWVLVGKPKGKRPLGRPRHGSAGSGMLGYGLDRAGSGQGQMVGTCECGSEPTGSIKCGESLA